MVLWMTLGCFCLVKNDLGTDLLNKVEKLKLNVFI